MIAHILKAIISVQTASDGDWVDWLNHRFTAILLAVLGILVSTKQYVGDPINCWTPAHFSKEWVDYTNTHCWISNTYYLPLNTVIKTGRAEGKTRIIKYYQWVPIILAFQGLLFYLPRTVWRGFCVSAGIDIGKIVATATTFESVLNPDLWTRTIQYLAKHYDSVLEPGPEPWECHLQKKILQAHTMSCVQHAALVELFHDLLFKGDLSIMDKSCRAPFIRYLDVQRDIGKGFLARIRLFLSRVLCVCSRHYGNYLNICYIIVKLLYLLNAIAQLFLLSFWLGDGYHLYGVVVIKDILNGDDWTNNGRFARVTLCDFKIRTLGSIQSHTVQCVLSINLFNEKIYLFVWFWLIFVSIVTLINLMEWMFRIVCLSDWDGYIKKHLRFMERYRTEEDRKMIKRFVSMYLRPDGVFLIRLLAKNTNSIIVSELVAELWDNYRGRSPFSRGMPPPQYQTLTPSSLNGNVVGNTQFNNHIPNRKALTLECINKEIEEIV